jgi:ribosomal protein L4
MPKKIIQKALSDVLRFKLKENKIVIFNDFGGDIKTSKIGSALSKNNFVSTLIIHDGVNVALTKSAQNLKNVKTLDVKALNVYDILNFDHILVDNKIFETNILGAIA